MLDCLGLRSARVVAAASRAQQRNNTSFDEQIKWVSTFAKNDLVYLRKHALAAMTKADDASKKLQKKKSRPIQNSDSPAENRHFQKE